MEKKDKMITKQDAATSIEAEDTLFNHIAKLIDESRKQIAKTINSAMVYTYYGVGQYIVEFEQEGSARAEYGKGVLKRLSARLTEKFGDGWSYANLRSMRQFYMVYSKMPTGGQQNQNDDHRSANHSFILPWTHY